jgi:hypothetical protein
MTWQKNGMTRQQMGWPDNKWEDLTTNGKTWQFWSGTLRLNDKFGWECNIFSSSEM